MRATIFNNLSTKIDPSVVTTLLDTFDELITAFRKGEAVPCLTAAGRFVEHTMRAIEYVRTGKAPPEIKSVDAKIREIEKDSTLSESLQKLIPHVAKGMVYDLRSKRQGVHVKEIDPRHIDISLCAHGASWILAEFLRLYHVDKESEVMQAMASLMRTELPFVETIDGEDVVTEVTTPEVEVLLHLANVRPAGMARRELGQRLKCTPTQATRAIDRLVEDRLIHKSKFGDFHITGPGERHLSDELAKLRKWAGVPPQAA